MIMARMLSDKPCEVTFLDRISNTNLTLFYRLPTTEERVKYNNELIRRVGNKIENKAGETRLKYGLRILLGVSDGSFETEQGPLSSDSQSPHYDPAWKNIVSAYASDVVEMLAIHAFEGSLSSPIIKEELEDKETDALSANSSGEEKTAKGF
jgi:hypothetical protein